MAFENSALTIVLNHPEADSYARLAKERFPHVRTIVAPDPEGLEQHIAQADALLAFRFPVEVLHKANNLRWFQCTGAGVDSMLSARDRAAHVTVTNARGIHGDVIADYVMAGVTMLHWDFRKSLREQAERQWKPRFIAPLAEKTLGVVGLGSIGATIARRAKSAGMTVVGSKQDVSSHVEGVDQLFAFDALKDFLPLCDFVVLALPATPDTVGLVGASEIARMRHDAFLINIARGNIVVEAELIRALKTGAIAGAMLDVFECEPLPKDSPLWDMPNVIATPHMAGRSDEVYGAVVSIFADDIERFINGQPLKNRVDLTRGY
ncbi:D-2-hydroxyacid dehydrogenase [Bradyrhizobium tropiciagri]|uniref:D-2-hydroxyacid dehydrogenase n=1 Tax=Bradyrhizobium tropiciagri TaxID=312253 RepID=UPI00067B1942|nr:D-2-hydroxyacid dehydrogenase [Bradyrhizobium tropiciagri]